jgi:hypothetical protein
MWLSPGLRTLGLWTLGLEELFCDRMAICRLREDVVSESETGNEDREGEDGRRTPFAGSTVGGVSL